MGILQKRNCFRFQWRWARTARLNCQFFSVPVFPQVTQIRGHRFQMQFIQCNKVFVFFWGRTMRTMVQHFYARQRKVQHYINIVIEYGHFRLKITGISRLTLSQWQSIACIELYYSQLCSKYYRRARGDMIEVYKYLHGKYNVEEVPLLLDEIRVTRGHSRRLKKERVQTRQRRNHFRHRTVNRWNSLTEEVVSAPSLNSFKSRLDELWRGYSYIQNDCFPVRTHRREDQLTGF